MRQRGWRVVAGVAVAMLAATLGAQTPERTVGENDPVAGAFPPRRVSEDFPLERLPRIDCSTSAQPLAMLIGVRLTGAESRWTGGDERRLMPVALMRENEPPESAAARVALARGLNERIVNTGTHGAYVALIEGRQDLILVARAPSPDELNLAKEKGVELDARPAALDAFVFMVNRENAANNLTTAQIRDIYTGRITNWKEVGGADQELRPYAREPNSGSQELMDTLVMKGVEVGNVRMPVEVTMMGPFRRLAQDKLALAYTVFFFAKRMAPRENTRLIAVDGVMPTSDTIRARRYPHVAEVFAVVRRDADPNGPAVKLRDWILSPAGQEVVAESGYVTLPKDGEARQ